MLYTIYARFFLQRHFLNCTSTVKDQPVLSIFCEEEIGTIKFNTSYYGLFHKKIRVFVIIHLPKSFSQDAFHFFSGKPILNSKKSRYLFPFCFFRFATNGERK